MTSAPARNYRPDIDGLRAIAVLAVVLFHAEVPFFHGGYVGVDIFFVISGYLITRNILSDIEAGHFTLRGFYVARFKRLIPAFLFALLVTFILGFLILSPIHFLELGKTTINAVLSLSNIFFWQDADYFATDSQYIPLLHTWSLSVEEQFYAIWPLFLVICMGMMARSALGLVLIIIGVASLGGAVWVANVDAPAGFYLMPFRMFEFCMGAGCIWLEGKRKQSQLESEIGMLAGLAMIAVSIFAFTVKTPFPSYYALLPCAGSALLILYGKSSISGLVLRNRLAVWIGLISYSLYLFHWPLLVFGKYVKFGALSPLETAGLLAASVALAVFSFRFVERPFRRLQLGSKPISSQSMVVGSLCVAMLTMFLGAHAWGGKGWKFRIDRDARRTMFLATLDVYSPCQTPEQALRDSGFHCTFGANDEAKPLDVALLGDSHAEHWLPGLDQVFKQAGVRAAYAGGGGALPFIVGKSMTASGPLPLSYAEPFEFVKKHKPKLVILGGRWAAYAHASRPDGVALWYGLETPSDSSAQASQKAIIRAATETLSQLTESGTKVVVLGQVPLVGVDLIACLSRPKFVGVLHQNPSCDGFTAQEVKARDAFMFNLLSRLTGDDPKRAYVDFVSRMCAGGAVCRKTIGKTVLYRDDDHLSFQGSVALMKGEAAATILRLLKAAP